MRLGLQGGRWKVGQERGLEPDISAVGFSPNSPSAAAPISTPIVIVIATAAASVSASALSDTASAHPNSGPLSRVMRATDGSHFKQKMLPHADTDTEWDMSSDATYKNENHMLFHE